MPVLSVVIVTTTLGAGFEVGVGFGRVGIGVGLEIVGVGGTDVGVGVGRVGVGDGAEGVFVVPIIVVLTLVGAGVAVAVLLSPPHAVNVINSTAIKRLNQAMRLDT